MKPKVTVVIVTYNHEAFIAEALESVLMQKTSFDFDILIGEDASTDKTKDILESYREKYPDKIKPVYREKNLGLVKNFADLLLRARGEYLATLAGDDFWTDEYKLQKQADFLDKHPEYSLYGLGAISLHQDTNKINMYGLAESRILDTGDIFVSNPIHASQTMYRNIFETIPDIFYDADTEDRQLYMLLTEHGRLYFDPLKIGGVYRVHSNSLTRKEIGNKRMSRIERLDERIRKSKIWNQYFKGKFQEQAMQSIALANAKKFSLLIELGRINEARKLARDEKVIGVKHLGKKKRMLYKLLKKKYFVI